MVVAHPLTRIRQTRTRTRGRRDSVNLLLFVCAFMIINIAILLLVSITIC